MLFNKNLSKIRLNLGSGIYPENGFLNIDIDPTVKPDIVRDIKRGLPFSSDCIAEVRAFHFLEHLNPTDFIFTMSEVYRVLSNKSLFDIQVPLGITDDPTHETFFHENSFNVFIDQSSQAYYRKQMVWKLKEKEILTQKFPTLHVVLMAIKR